MANVVTRTHQTTPTQFVEANGIRFAYRRFGKSGGVREWSRDLRLAVPVGMGLQ